MSDNFNPTEWITTGEAAELTGHHAVHIRRLIRDRHIEGAPGGASAIIAILPTSKAVDCDQRAIPADDAEAALGDFLRYLKLPDDWQARVLALLETSTRETQDVAREKAHLEGQLDRLKRLYVLGDLGVNVVAIAQGSSERNISIVIAKADEVPVKQALHAEFFGR